MFSASHVTRQPFDLTSLFHLYNLKFSLKLFLSLEKREILLHVQVVVELLSNLNTSLQIAYRKRNETETK